MRAAYYDERGDLERLQVGERPTPTPGSGEVLVEIHAAAIGMWDVNVLMGRFGDPPLPRIPGCEIAGVVEAGSGGPDLEAGDEVYGYLGFDSGGLAEYAAVAPDRLVRPCLRSP